MVAPIHPAGIFTNEKGMGHVRPAAHPWRAAHRILYFPLRARRVCTSRCGQALFDRLSLWFIAICWGMAVRPHPEDAIRPAAFGIANAEFFCVRWIRRSRWNLPFFKTRACVAAHFPPPQSCRAPALPTQKWVNHLISHNFRCRITATI